MRIALWNGSGVDNFGDRLLDFINRRELRKRIPNAQIDTFSPWPSKNAPKGFQAHPLVIKSDGTWCGQGQYDAIVIGGGALLNGPPFVHPGSQVFYLGANPQIFKDYIPIAWNAVCSDGHFAAGIMNKCKEYVQSALNRIQFRSVRNKRTADFIKECSVIENVQIVQDTAVLLENPTHKRCSKKRGKKIGIAIARPVFPTEFLQEMWKFANDYIHLSGGQPDQNLFAHKLTHLRDHSKTEYNEVEYVQLYKAALGSDLLNYADLQVGTTNNAMYDDYRPAKILAEKLGITCFVFDDPLGADLLTWIRSLDCLIASRLHMCILALVAETPVVAIDPYFNPIIGTNKLKEFMSSIQRFDDYLTLEAFFAKDTPFYSLVQEAISKGESLPEIHRSCIDEVSSHFDRLANFIISGESST
jgi:polysaccharide pyruvyl transferase WcaK-like protein